MKSRNILSVLLIAGLLGACVDTQSNQKQTVGTLLGAGVGALAGSQVGGGKGQLAAVVIGALGGAFLGGQIGKSLDEVDRMKAGQAQHQALEQKPDGMASAWSNPNTGHSGQVKPTRTYQTASGENCREYQHEVVIDGRRETASGTACRQPDGTWRSIN